MDPEQLYHFSLPCLIGFLLGLSTFWVIHVIKVGNYKSLATDILHKAELEAESLKKTSEIALKQQEIEQKHERERLWQAEQRKLLAETDRLKQCEEKIDTRNRSLKDKIKEIEKAELSLSTRKKQVIEKEVATETQRNNLILELEKASGLTSHEAKSLILERIKTQVQTELANLTRKLTAETKENADLEATRIITTAINRLAVPCVSETAVSTIPLPSEEMKGRIIGKEGRNIRALEQETGVNFIIDDTPCAVVISGFDPIRKAVAKTALIELIEDGRIHPTRIEEAVVHAKEVVMKQAKQFGQDAALQVGIINLHPEISNVLGTLKFRYSYGQNVLDHSIEVARILGMMAAELGLDVDRAKRIGLLHDIGKALTHEHEGTHGMIGYNFLKRFGESEEVANGCVSHHDEEPPACIESSLCNAADAISAARPGARIEAVEHYFKRLQQLEEIALSYYGVEKAYALQAGREIRVIVHPDDVSDDDIVNLSRELANRIEDELTFPGKVKVTIIRERRAVEYAV